jgi:hypothetical protein
LTAARIYINNIIYINPRVKGVTMNEADIFKTIKNAIAKNQHRNQRTLEIHLQMLKHADQLKDITAKEFCEGTGLASSYGTEFSKMRNLTERLKNAGLDFNKI